MTTKLLEQLILESEQAAEPAASQVNDVVHRPDNTLPVAMVAGQTLSAGYVYIYDTRSGERSVTNRNMLLAQLKKVRKRQDASEGYPEGSLIFTTVKPSVEPQRGTLTCLLHADRPERAHYDALGLPVCPKANLPTQFQVMQHMRHRHHIEWGTIEEEQTRREKDQDRVFQKSVIELAGHAQAPDVSRPIRKRRKISKPDPVTET